MSTRQPARKLFRFLVIAAIFSMSATVCFGATAGNVDGSIDGIVDLKDAILAIQTCAGLASTVQVHTQYEISGDSKVGLEEAIYALQIVAGVKKDDSDPNATPKYFSVPGTGSTLDFGEVMLGNNVSQDLSIANTGDSDLKVNFVTLGGTHADDFRIGTQAFPLIIKNGIPQSMIIVCSPSTTGERRAELRLSCNDPKMPAIFEYSLKCIASSADPTCNLNTLFDIENNRSVGSPGKGYDSDRDRVKPSRCLNGDEIEVGGGVGELTTTQVTAYEELYEKVTTTKKYGGGLNIKIPFFFGLDLGLDFGKKKTIKFISETREKTLSESFVYQYEVRVPNLEFQLDTAGEQLNALGKSVLGNKCQFRSACGDQFIYQTERGASLYVALTFDFASESHKEAFDRNSGGNFGISLSKKSVARKAEEKGLLSINTEWSDIYANISEEIKKHTRFSIHVLQIGGNVVALPAILGEDFSDDETPALSCSLDEINPCRDAINRIVQYASTKEFAEGVETTPAILNYRYRSYEEAGIFPGLTSELTEDIRQDRENLAQVFEEQIGDKEHAEFKLDEFKAMLSESEKAELNALINTLKVNLNNLRDSASVCFSNLPACKNSVDEVFGTLLPYDESLLDLPVPITIADGEEVLLEGTSQPIDIDKYCELPPNYVLTGVGVSVGGGNHEKWNSWDTVRLEGRRINANGTLGSREIFCDGIFSHWVSVPDDKNLYHHGTRCCQKILEGQGRVVG